MTIEESVAALLRLKDRCEKDQECERIARNRSHESGKLFHLESRALYNRLRGENQEGYDRYYVRMSDGSVVCIEEDNMTMRVTVLDVKAGTEAL